MPTRPSSAAEKGNAFILVALACIFFGALCYMVINAGNSGGAAQEKDLMSAAQITQYPAALRTHVRRMMANGVAANDITFAPQDVTPSGVFSPAGGGAFLQDPPAGIGGASQWRFKSAPASDTEGVRGWYVAGVGSDGLRGKDIFAYLEHLSLEVCAQILRGLALPEEPLIEPETIDFSGADEGTQNQTGGAAGDVTLAGAAGKYSFNAWDAKETPQSYACVQNGEDGSYVYYHVLVDR